MADTALTTHKMRFADSELTISTFAADQLITSSLANDGVWEPWQLGLMDRIIKPDFICVDIGANVGVNSLFMAQKCPRGKVYSFEPFTLIYEVLKQNAEQNRLPNIVPINKGISSERASLNMVTDMRSVGGAHISDFNSNAGNYVSGSFQFVALEEELKSHGVEKVDFIKIDVEGHELHALQGAGKLLDNPDLQLVIEFNPRRLCAVNDRRLFSDRRLYSLLKSKFRHIFFMNRTGTLYECRDYHALRRCLLGGYFVDDLYCTNQIPREIEDLISTEYHVPLHIMQTRQNTDGLKTMCWNRDQDGWSRGNEYMRPNMSLMIQSNAPRVVLAFDRMYKKHLPNHPFPTWPIAVMIGDVVFDFDLMETPQSIQFDPGPDDCPVTIESEYQVPAAVYLGNPGDPRNIGFRCDIKALK